MTTIAKIFSTLLVLFLGMVISAIIKETVGRGHAFVLAAAVAGVIWIWRLPPPHRRSFFLYCVKNADGLEGTDGFTREQLLGMNDADLLIQREDETDYSPIKHHPDFQEPNQVVTSLFEEIFDNCDLEFAKEQVRHRFAGGVYPQALVDLFDAFDRAPTQENAEALIRYDPSFAVLFENNVSTKRFMGDDAPWNGSRFQGISVLREQPEFDELVGAITDDRERYRELVNALIERGYSAETISSAVAQ